MARYYRCGNPEERCDLSKTKEIATQGEWELHCKDSPDCATYAEPVSWFGTLSRRVKFVATAAAALLLLVGSLVAFRPDPLQKDLAVIRAELGALSSRLLELEARTSNKTPAEAALQSIQQFQGRVQTASKQLSAVVKAQNASAVENEKSEISKIKEQFAKLKKQIHSESSNEGDLQVQSAQLKTSYEALQERLQVVASRLTSGSSAKLIAVCSTTQEEIEDGLSRVSRLIVPQPVDHTKEFDELTRSIEASISHLDRLVGSYLPSTKVPFTEAEATLKIAVTGDLGEALVLPLLNGQSTGEIVKQDDRWYFTSKTNRGSNTAWDSAAAEKVFVEKIQSNPYEGLSEKRYDLVISDTTPSNADRAKFSSSFDGATMDSHSNAQVIAMDALTFCVSPESQMESLSSRDLTNGTEFIGGEDGTPSNLAANRFEIKLSKVSKREPADAVLSSNGLVGVGVYHNEGANIRAKRLAFQPSVTAQALKPSPFTIATEDYKYSFRIVATNSPASRTSAIDFVKFITSQAGQEIVGNHGFVDLRLIVRGDVDPIRSAALGQATGLKKFSGAQRLSTNLRFESGEDHFDLKALGDLERLPRQIARDFPNARIVILGFTDNTGGPSINVPLSQRRAETVAVDLRRSGVDAKSAGLGDQLAVDTNDSDEGKARNRRSEVWIVNP
jgi:outer membrane protein OmpA-like peptidoglycan-associated protein/FtsZ-binding cell division protein ZapB